MPQQFLHIGSLKRFVLPTLLSVLLSACATIPKENFDAYRNSYSQARNASEDVILRGKIAARVLADDPANTESPADRLAKLNEREKAADERILALEAIDRYNAVLVLLAEGKDPVEIRGNLQKLGNSLGQLNSSRLSAAVGKAVPYAGIASEIIAMVDDSMNRQKFLELVKKGHEPVFQIIDILIADAGNIETIISQQILTPRDTCDGRLSDLNFRFLKLANGLQPTQDVSELVKAINDTRAKVVHRKLPVVAPQSGSAVPGQTDVEMLRLLVGVTENEVTAANIITAKDKAHRRVMDEYKKLLEQTKLSLAQLEKAIEFNRPAATVDFVQRALALREASIKLKEGM